MSEMKEVKWYTDQEIFDCLDIHHMCRGPYVLTSDYDALLSEKAALARDRDAHRDALQDIFVDVERYCRERDRLRDEVRHLRTAIAGAREAIEDGYITGKAYQKHFASAPPPSSSPSATADATLRAALEKYGRHSSKCMLNGGDPAWNVCTCGLDAALAKDKP